MKSKIENKRLYTTQITTTEQILVYIEKIKWREKYKVNKIYIKKKNYSVNNAKNAIRKSTRKKRKKKLEEKVWKKYIDSVLYTTFDNIVDSYGYLLHSMWSHSHGSWILERCKYSNDSRRVRIEIIIRKNRKEKKISNRNECQRGFRSPDFFFRKRRTARHTQSYYAGDAFCKTPFHLQSRLHPSRFQLAWNTYEEISCDVLRSIENIIPIMISLP